MAPSFFPPIILLHFILNFSSVWVVSSVVALVDVETGKLVAELPGMCHGYQVQRPLNVV